MWTIRFILLCMLCIMDWIGAYLIRHRSQYNKLLDNMIYNVAYVTVGHCLCYLIVILPPAGGWNARPGWLQYTSVRISFPVVGLLLICAGALLAIATLRQRKTIGFQDVKKGLLTSGCYRYFRHPINVGILWICLGLPLLMRNPDGLLVLPAIYVIFFAGTILEETNDMCARFPEQYKAYRQNTRMFGPIWLWSTIIVIILLIVGLGRIIEMR
jgi:protein-S-isoprenylcysteine O-methyltransferase Ste14